jgi:hypothetical protein
MALKKPHLPSATYARLLPSESNCGSTFAVIGIKVLRGRHFPSSRTIDERRNSPTVHEPDSELFDDFWEEIGPLDIQKFLYTHNNINANFLSFLTTDVGLALLPLMFIAFRFLNSPTSHGRSRCVTELDEFKSLGFWNSKK